MVNILCLGWMFDCIWRRKCLTRCMRCWIKAPQVLADLTRLLSFLYYVFHCFVLRRCQQPKTLPEVRRVDSVLFGIRGVAQRGLVQESGVGMAHRVICVCSLLLLVCTGQKIHLELNHFLLFFQWEHVWFAALSRAHRGKRLNPLEPLPATLLL